MSNNTNRRRNGQSNSLLPTAPTKNYHQYLTTSTDSYGKPKYTTRHLAALDFLLNIPMANEQSIRELGLENANRVQSIEETAQRATDIDNIDESIGIFGIDENNLYDYNALTNSETSTSKDAIKESKNFFSRGIITSIIRNESEDSHSQAAHAYELPTRDWKGHSYSYLFKSIEEEYILSTDKYYYYIQGYLYDPEIVDDSYRNDFLICLEIPVELSTVALAVINYERLLLKGIVNKSNKKLTIAASILLAYKFNESFNKTKLILLYDFIDKNYQINKEKLIDAEFPAYVHLNFTLHVPVTHMHFIYTKLLKLLSMTSTIYLGQDMHDIYIQDMENDKMNKLISIDIDNNIDSNRINSSSKLLSRSPPSNTNSNTNHLSDSIHNSRKLSFLSTVSH